MFPNIKLPVVSSGISLLVLGLTMSSKIIDDFEGWDDQFLRCQFILKVILFLFFVANISTHTVPFLLLFKVHPIITAIIVGVIYLISCIISLGSLLAQNKGNALDGKSTISLPNIIVMTPVVGFVRLIYLDTLAYNYEYYPTKLKIIHWTFHFLLGFGVSAYLLAHEWKDDIYKDMPPSEDIRYEWKLFLVATIVLDLVMFCFLNCCWGLAKLGGDVGEYE